MKIKDIPQITNVPEYVKCDGCRAKEQELADLNKAYDNLQDCHLQVCNEHVDLKAENEKFKQLVGKLKNHYPDDGKLAGVQYPEVIYRLLQAIKEE